MNALKVYKSANYKLVNIYKSNDVTSKHFYSHLCSIWPPLSIYNHNYVMGTIIGALTNMHCITRFMVVNIWGIIRKGGHKWHKEYHMFCWPLSGFWLLRCLVTSNLPLPFHSLHPYSSEASNPRYPFQIYTSVGHSWSGIDIVSTLQHNAPIIIWPQGNMRILKDGWIFLNCFSHPVVMILVTD